MAANKIIIAGDVKEGVEEWLQAHGARVEYCLGLVIAELPARAEVHQDTPPTTWHVTVGFVGADGEDEDTYLNIETAEDDAQETVWELIAEKGEQTATEK